VQRANEGVPSQKLHNLPQNAMPEHLTLFQIEVKIRTTRTTRTMIRMMVRRLNKNTQATSEAVEADVLE
jgi:hypothetical protein